MESFRLRLYDRVISVKSIFGFSELYLDEIDSYRLVKHPKGHVWTEFLSKSGARKKHLKAPKECDGYGRLLNGLVQETSLIARNPDGHAPRI